MPQTEPWTVGRLLEWTTDFLRGHGADSPRLDAEVLLAEACDCRRIDLYTRFDQEPQEESRVAFRELVRRRSEGMPVAYLVGHREFYSLSFRVTPDVLIPRPETEFVVVELLDLARPEGSGQSLQIADVGTGSGILAVCAAKNLPQCQVTAIDISAAALEVARSNAADHELDGRIEFLESDLFSAVPEDRRFDFIVSNPPYITTAEMQQLPRDVRDFEPHSALAAGQEGIDVIGPLLQQSAQRLVPGGYLLCEISPMLEEVVSELCRADERWQTHRFVKDLAGCTRVLVAQKSSTN